MKVLVTRMVLVMTNFGIMAFQSMVLAVDPDELIEHIRNITRNRVQIAHR